MAGYNFFPPHPRLAAVVEAIWDHDVPDTRARFANDIGIPPKQFARIARIGKVIAAARGPDTDWPDVAAASGFSDQAHMIKEFNAMVGRPPDAFFRVTSLRDRAAPGVSGAESDFYNTFVCEAGNLPAG